MRVAASGERLEPVRERRPSRRAGIRRILVAVDLADLTRAVTEIAVDLAAATGAEVHLLHVQDIEPGSADDVAGPEEAGVAANRLDAARRQLQAVADQVTSHHIPALAVLRRHDAMTKEDAARLIVEEADRRGADLIVMGTHGHGWLYHLLTGNVHAGVLRGAACPVVFVPPSRNLRAAAAGSEGQRRAAAEA